ncbi:hypothetical protein [Variovorax atrisoli]|uniref:hypothetical protein n=1 Tax=Variovorax atrisoli TaxID=3394203 RepID=UPI0012FE2CF4|nr:hypothetical protein [Variovorax paradoxus]
MASIWVMNPQSKERLQVPNIDPVKATLSAYQIKVAYGLQRRTREQGQKITISQAIQRARDSARDLANATTQSARRRALRLMGLSVEEPVVKAKAHLPTTVQPQTSRKRKVDAKHGLAEPIEQASGGSPAGDETPSFPTVVRAPHVATRARP